MVRTLGLPRFAAGLALLPLVALLSSACGGTDQADSPDAADARAADVSSGDSRNPEADAPGAEAAVVDAGARDGALDGGAGRDADATTSRDSEAGTTDSGLRIDAAIDGPRLDGALLDVMVPDALLDARGPDADALVDLDARLIDAEAALADVVLDARGDGTLLDVSALIEAGQTGDAGDGASEAADARDASDAADGAEAGVSLLRSAARFAVLAGQAVTITPAPPLTTIVGDVGVSPGSSIATLPVGQPVGQVHAGDPVALQAQSDVTAAYNQLAGMPCLPANNRTDVDLGGLTLAPAVYCFDTSAGLTGNLVLDAQQNPNAMWVFQIGSTLTTATNATVTVINGGSACNVYWQVGSSATLGTNTAFAGNIVALASVTLVTGSTIAVGRTIARSGSVNFDGNAVSALSCQ